MQHILKVSEAASLGLHTMAYLAAQPNKRISTHEVAEKLKVSEAHLAKVMQRLGRAGLVVSQRGPKGGFTLAKPPDKITLLEVYEAIEGKLNKTGCLLGKPVCDGDCILGGLLNGLDRQVREYFSTTKLLDIALASLWEVPHVTVA